MSSTTGTYHHVRHLGQGANSREASLSERFGWSVFTITLIGSCLPVKNVHYLVPWAIAAHLALSGAPRTLRRLIGGTAVLVAFSIVGAQLSMGTINTPGVAWAALTYSPLLFLVVLDRRVFAHVSSGSVRTLSDLLSLVVILQSVLGVVQLAVSGNPDAVAGTFDPTGFLTGVTISQVYLAAFLIGAALFLWATGSTLLHRTAAVAAVVCVIISQSGHQTILAVAALAIASVLVAPSPRRIAGAIAFVAFSAALVQALSPATIERAEGWFDKTVVSDDSLKRQVWGDALDVVSDFPATAFGYGGGQFSSRAGLIASGDYLSVSMPDPLTGRSPVFAEQVDPADARFEAVGEGSAISKPYSSVTSVLAEFGPLVFLTALSAVVMAIVRQLRLGNRAGPRERKTRTALAAGAMFYGLLCLVENYLEFPQALLVPGLLYIIADKAADEMSQPVVGAKN